MTGEFVVPAEWLQIIQIAAVVSTVFIPWASCRASVRCHASIRFSPFLAITAAEAWSGSPLTIRSTQAARRERS